jgi:hypothetical protein
MVNRLVLQLARSFPLENWPWSPIPFTLLSGVDMANFGINVTTDDVLFNDTSVNLVHNAPVE